MERWNEFMEAVMAQLRSKGSIDADLLVQDFPEADQLWMKTAGDLAAFFTVTRGGLEKIRQQVTGYAPAIEGLWDQTTVGQLFTTVTAAQALQHGVSQPALVRLKREQTVVRDLRTPAQQTALSRRLGVPTASFVTLFADALDSEVAERELSGQLFAARRDSSSVPPNPLQGEGDKRD